MAERTEPKESLFGENDVARVLDRGAVVKKHLAFVDQIGSAGSDGANGLAGVEPVVEQALKASSRNVDALLAQWKSEASGDGDGLPKSDRREFFVSIGTLELGPDAEARLSSQRESLSAEDLNARAKIGTELLHAFFADMTELNASLRKAGKAQAGEVDYDSADDLTRLMKHVEACFELGKRTWMGERARIGALEHKAPTAVKLGGERLGELLQRKDPKLLRLIAEGWQRDLLPATSLEKRGSAAPRIEGASVILSPAVASKKDEPAKTDVEPSTDEPMVKLAPSTATRPTQRIAPTPSASVGASEHEPLETAGDRPKKSKAILLVGIVALAIVLAGAIGWWGSTRSGNAPEPSNRAPTTQTAPRPSADLSPAMTGTNSAPQMQDTVAPSVSTIAAPPVPPPVRSVTPSATATAVPPPPSVGTGAGDLWKGGE